MVSILSKTFDIWINKLAPTFLRTFDISNRKLTPCLVPYRDEPTHPPQSQGGGPRDIRFAELDIPRTIPTYSPPWISGIDGSPPTDAGNGELRRKRACSSGYKGPTFKPYLTPKLHAPPWLPDTSSHLSAQAQRGIYARISKNAHLPLELIIQSPPLYRLRCVLAADLCSSWPGFGGLGARLSRLSIVLNLSVIETAGVALTYRNGLLPEWPGKLASARPTKLNLRRRCQLNNSMCVSRLAAIPIMRILTPRLSAHHLPKNLTDNLPNPSHHSACPLARPKPTAPPLAA